MIAADITDAACCGHQSCMSSSSSLKVYAPNLLLLITSPDNLPVLLSLRAWGICGAPSDGTGLGLLAQEEVVMMLRRQSKNCSRMAARSRSKV